MGYFARFSPTQFYFAGDTNAGVLFSNAGPIDQGAATPTETLTLLARNEFGAPSTFYITFTIAKSGGAGAIACRIYVNDVAVGTNRTAANTYSEQITVATGASGTKIQLYASGDGVGTNCRITNITIKAAMSLFEQTIP